ncbi:YjbH domain-containing protein [Vibrio campbellii]|uniref:YjbH domain-containing protein n=1 Tax=Vibrio campbellii TaxID=680 RepID=UPI00210A51FB|nr:YjbH domain-containing protein [Vibrio campbellii]UTZ40097.1 YjbH domain-containing protein [Vibrio campbellii]
MLRLNPITCSLISLAALPFTNSYANDFTPVELRPSQTDFGGVGLMQMPSGRMAEEGEFNFGVNINDDYQHYYTSLQLMPWFETTIRYTRVPDAYFNSDPSYSGENLYTDKGIDFKVRLIKESYWLPETSIGVRDFGGTGLFDGEFIAATKQFRSKDYGVFDVTLGMGWGYIGQSGNITNPFCKLSDKYCDRDSAFKNNGGSVDFERWFKGPASLYGGIEYQTPYQPLRFKVEYDANDYSEDFPTQRSDKNPNPKSMTQHTPWNFGALYQLGNWADIKLSYQRGNTITFGFNLYTNFNELSAVWRDVQKEKLQTRPSKLDTDWNIVSKQLSNNAGYRRNSIAEKDDVLVVKGEQTKYRNRKESLDRAAAILANNSPEYIKTYKIVETSKGVPVTETDINAEQYQRVSKNEYIDADVTDSLADQALSSTRGAQLAQSKDQWRFGLSPVLQQSIGGPESFYFYNIGVNAEANYWLLNSLELSGSVYFNIADNYDKFNYIDNDPHISNFAVPRVRTLIRSYIHDNPVRMNQLQLTWFSQPTDNLYTQIYGGYLETMFAGVGGEVLYRPQNSNWALGLDVNLISQRDPDSWFGVYDDPFFYYDGYNESNCKPGQVDCQAYVLDKGTTGQLAAYYMPTWNWLEGTLFKLSAGEFLAGDKGARLEFSKQFKSGVIVGAYATMTDLTPDEYGEGSYNKGFYVSIPFDIMTVKPSTNRGVIGWQPITRDGGQTLNRKYHLFNVTDARSPWFQRPNTSDEK